MHALSRTHSKQISAQAAILCAKHRSLRLRGFEVIKPNDYRTSGVWWLREARLVHRHTEETSDVLNVSDRLCFDLFLFFTLLTSLTCYSHKLKPRNGFIITADTRPSLTAETITIWNPCHTNKQVAFSLKLILKLSLAWFIFPVHLSNRCVLLSTEWHVYKYTIANLNVTRLTLPICVSTQMHGKRILKLLQKIFSWLPLATVVDQKVLVLHGGISDSTDLSVLARVDRHNVRSHHVVNWFN